MAKDHSDKFGQLVKQRTELEEHVQVLKHASKWFGQANRYLNALLEVCLIQLGEGVGSPSLLRPWKRKGGMKCLRSSTRMRSGSMLEQDGAEVRLQAGITRRPPSMLGHIAGCIPTANMRDFTVKHRKSISYFVEVLLRSRSFVRQEETCTCSMRSLTPRRM